MAENKEESKSVSVPFNEQMHILKRILKYTKPYLSLFFTAIIFVIGLAIMNALMPRVIQIFIDDYLIKGLTTKSTAVKFGAIYMGLTLVNMVITFLELYLFNLASEKTVLNIRNQLFEKIHSLGMSFFDSTSTGWIVTRVTNDTESLKDFWNVLLNIIQSV